jgi:phage/plasmid-like protein (TIGR03299 family)
MSAELDYSTGDAAFVEFGDRVTAWHRAGFHITPEEFEALTWDERIALIKERGRLNWSVDQHDIYTSPHGGTIVPGYKRFVRSDNGALFGVWPESYTIMQNDEIFELIRPLFEEGVLTFETAGSLRDGKDVWLLAQFNPQEQAVRDFFSEDGTVPYFLIADNKARERLLIMMETMIKIVCRNTHRAALGTYGQKGAKAGRYPGAVLLRHTKNVKSLSVDAVREMWGNLTERYGKIVESYTLLKATFMAREEFNRVVLDTLAPLPTELEAPRFDSTFDRAQTRRQLVTKLWDGEGRGITGNHTAYEAYMATTEALEHYPDVFKIRESTPRLQALFPGGSLADKGQDVLNLLQRFAETPTTP